MALDFTVEGMSAEDVRNWISSIEDKLPFKVRLEWKHSKNHKTITWVHLDVAYYKNNPKVYKFYI